jgi:uncharacterized protein with beta-barrel porin domain
LNGQAVGSATGGATNKLVLQGSGTANNNFIDFNSLEVQASGTWVWDNNSTIGATAISSGTLAVDGGLTSPVTVNSGGTLAGRGTVNGDVSVAGGGAVAPGGAVPFSTLTVNGNVSFAAGSVLKVNVNAGGTKRQAFGHWNRKLWRQCECAGAEWHVYAFDPVHDLAR